MKRWFASLGAATMLLAGLETGFGMSGAEAAVRVTFPLLRAQQLLARLGYLPLAWRIRAGARKIPLAASWSTPPRGIWTWKPGPAILRSLWTTPGSHNILTRGALMTFQRVNGLTATGTLNLPTERALGVAWLHRRIDPHGYSYALVDEYQGSPHPETITLWHNGRRVLRCPVNTGIAETPTPLGTFPVYLRYYSQTMAGKTPWASYYNDPGVPYVNYIHGGVAVHGFIRRAYGFPQSLGCIELPVADAAIAWVYLHIGTLVTVVPTADSGSMAVNSAQR